MRRISMILPLSFALPLTLAVATAVAVPGAEPQPLVRIKIEPYILETNGQKLEAEMGRLQVRENRTRKDSRSIELVFVRLKSTAREPGPPIVFLAGGPGGSGIDAARGPGLPAFLALREAGDVILLDQRGTGQSQPDLACSETWDFPLDKSGSPGLFVPIARQRLRACAERLRARGIDLTGYNVRESADDIDDLRRALGAPAVDLWGISYGTHLALAAIRRHGDGIRRAVLTGVEGPDEATLKLPSALDEQLRKVSARLEADPEAARSIPRLTDLFRTLLEKLERQAATVEVADRRSGQKVQVTVGPWDLQFFAAARINSTWGIRGLSGFLGPMAKGDFAPLAEAALEYRHAPIGTMLAWTTLTASGASSERQARVSREARSALLGDAVNFPFPAIVDAVGVPDLGPDFRSPLRSSIPVLLISGGLDGDTPAANAHEVKKGLPNGEELNIEGASHGFDLFFFNPQARTRMVEFLKAR